MKSHPKYNKEKLALIRSLIYYNIPIITINKIFVIISFSKYVLSFRCHPIRRITL